MTRFLINLDLLIRRILTWFCALMLFSMVIFTIYTVFMRYVFLNPPVWGDLMTLFCNIWLVFAALALTTREKQHIALDMLYGYLPDKYAFGIQQMWNLIICGLGFVIMVWGWQVAQNNPGLYWEMGYMPKRYPMYILPISGCLIFVGAFVAFLEDVIAYRKGEFTLGKGEANG